MAAISSFSGALGAPYDPSDNERNHDASDSDVELVGHTVTVNDGDERFDMEWSSQIPVQHRVVRNFYPAGHCHVFSIKLPWPLVHITTRNSGDRVEIQCVGLRDSTAMVKLSDKGYMDWIAKEFDTPMTSPALNTVSALIESVAEPDEEFGGDECTGMTDEEAFRGLEYHQLTNKSMWARDDVARAD